MRDLSPHLVNAQVRITYRTYNGSGDRVTRDAHVTGIGDDRKGNAVIILGFGGRFAHVPAKAIDSIQELS